MGLVTTRTIVLQTYRYSDTSKILRLMTAELGPRSALARGALRPRSRFGGLLEPFVEGVATLYVRENRELCTLSGFELIRARQPLARDVHAFTGASVLCELVLRLAPEHPDKRLYGELTRGLDALMEAPGGAVETVALRHIWRLVVILGFEPDLDACVECHRPIPVGRGARFDFEAGGLRCGECAPVGRRVDPVELAGLRGLLGRAEEVAGPVGASQGRLVADFIRYHMAEGTRLRSLDFLGGLP
ncbi:MAG: DNA repair protein RecO [Gemmatimonadota bacterium]